MNFCELQKNCLKRLKQAQIPTEAAAYNVETDTTVQFDSAPTGSNNTGITNTFTYGEPFWVGTPAPSAVVTIPGVGSIDLGPYLDDQGGTTVEVILTSDDGLVTAIFPLGTQVLDAEGNVLDDLIIWIIILHTPPPAPEDCNVIGPVYDFGPDGATFEPGITMIFTYDPADIPDGVNEEDLILAYWDGDNWNFLPTTVDAVAHTVTTEVSYFTSFAILAGIGVAAFTASDLSITPAEVESGEEVTISVLVANTGELASSYEVALNIDGVVVASEEVALAAGASEGVSFTTAKDVAGTYEVTVGGLSGTFVVKEAAPTPPPSPPPAPPPAKGTNWWLIGGIIAGCIIIGMLILLVARRRY